MNRFDEALERWLEPRCDLQPQHIKTITHALKLAARLEQDPSKDMLRAAPYRNTEDEGCMYHGIFKPMIEQLKKEVEDAS